MTLLQEALPVAAAPDEPLCTCLQYIGDNPPCPVHGEIVDDPRTDAERALDE